MAPLDDAQATLIHWMATQTVNFPRCTLVWSVREEMALFGSYHRSDCHVSSPYPSKLKRHFEMQMHQLLEAIENATTHNAHKQMELDSNNMVVESKKVTFIARMRSSLHGVM